VSEKPEAKPARIHWEGNSREILSGFPSGVREELGFSLWELQQGKTPTSTTRRMESVGPGVWELKEQDQRTWYRVLYLSKIDGVIYVLHCFEKQSRKTDRRDLDIARKRLSRVRERIHEQGRPTSHAKDNE
jgi:phage-related protein